MSTEILTVQQIKDYYAQVKDKTAFSMACSEKFGPKANSISTTWFTRFFNVPKQHHAILKEMFEQTIAQQA